MSGISVMFQSLQLMTACLLIINCSACSTGWFGSQCQYKCHCQDMKCSETGECVDTSCERGWFDYLCQYQNFMEIPNTFVTGVPSDIPLNWLTDGSDSTCNNNPGLQSVTVKFELQLVFTWLHLTVKEGEKADNVALLFEKSGRPGEFIGCDHIDVVPITKSGRRFELSCYLNEPVSKVILSGSQLKNLCALQINGGRNIALKQDVSIEENSQTISQGSSSLAVDGNSSPKYDTCAKPVISLTLTFNKDFMITRILLYAREDFKDLHVKFDLSAYNARNDLQVRVQDYTTDKKKINEVLNGHWKSPWRYVIVNSTLIEDVMPLCEVEAFGDCPLKTAGLYCETCEGRCTLGECYRDGTCKLGCLGPTIPPLCIQKCTQGTWGKDCIHSCSNQCSH
ncbi:unnamed protein product, partial [Lymnaea stagnalis]